jgi:sugar phosphate isomerase/epimerase
MKLNQVSAQLYTIRDYLKTPADIAVSMKKIRAIGYRSVQVSGMGPIDEKELAKILDGEGLVCCATHEGTATILNEPRKIVDRLGKLSCAFTAIPHPGNLLDGTMQSVDKFTAAINAAGKVLADAGMTLTYHNHNNEFRKIDGKTVLELIYDKTNPKYLQGEIDTYWVQAGGANPTSWCKKLTGRLPLLHLKDFGMNDQNQGVFREIGQGNLEWETILPQAQKGGCKWYIIEQDGNWADGDPFKSLEISFKYMKEKWAQ